MEWAPFVIVVVAAIVTVSLWGRPRGSRRTIDEAIASDALAREQDEQRTESIYNADRYNVPTGTKRF